MLNEILDMVTLCARFEERGWLRLALSRTRIMRDIQKCDEELKSALENFNVSSYLLLDRI